MKSNYEGAQFSPATSSPVGTSNEPIHKIDAAILTKLDEALSAQIPVRVELPDGQTIPFEEYGEDVSRTSEISLLAEDDGDEGRPKTRAALQEMAQSGTIPEDEIEPILSDLAEMGGRTDASVLTNVCKSDWGESS